MIAIRAVSTETLKRMLVVLRDTAPRLMADTIRAIEEELLRRSYAEELCSARGGDA